MNYKIRMPRRDDSQKQKIAAAFVDWCERMDYKLNELGGEKEPGGRLQKKMTQVYAISRGRAVPTIRDIDTMVKLECKKNPTLTAEAERKRWQDLIKPQLDGVRAIELSELSRVQPEVFQFLEKALAAVGTRAKRVNREAMLSLIMNRVSQELAHTENAAWTKEAVNPRVLFYWADASEAADWLSMKGMAEELWSYVQSRYAKDIPTGPAIFGCLGGRLKGTRKQIQDATEGIRKAAHQLNQQLKRFAFPANAGETGDLLKIRVWADGESEPNTLSAADFWVYTRVDKNSWLRATLNVEDQVFTDLGDEIAAAEPGGVGVKWSTKVVELPPKDAEALLKQRGITVKPSADFIFDNWEPFSLNSGPNSPS